MCMMYALSCIPMYIKREECVLLSTVVSHVQVGLATPSCLFTKSADALKCISTPIVVTVL